MGMLNHPTLHHSVACRLAIPRQLDGFGHRVGVVGLSIGEPLDLSPCVIE
jgi:hypothetical protein